MLKHISKFFTLSVCLRLTNFSFERPGTVFPRELLFHTLWQAGTRPGAGSGSGFVKEVGVGGLHEQAPWPAETSLPQAPLKQTGSQFILSGAPLPHFYLAALLLCAFWHFSIGCVCLTVVQWGFHWLFQFPPRAQKHAYEVKCKLPVYIRRECKWLFASMWPCDKLATLSSASPLNPLTARAQPQGPEFDPESDFK